MEKTLLDCILLLVLGFFFLVKGSDMFVDGASNVAKKLKIPTIIIGLTLVSIGTSAPELSASINSAIINDSNMNFGNVVGSNIFNLLVVIGASSLFVPLVISKQILKYDLPILLGIYGLLAMFTIVISPNELVLWESIVILLLAVIYTVFLILRNKKEIKEEKAKTIDENLQLSKKNRWWKNILFIVLGLAGIVGGGRIVVDNAKQIAEFFKVDSLIIGLTVVAIGTSLPELVTSIVAAKKGENDIAVANVIGSNIFNVLLILGSSSIINNIMHSPLEVASNPNFVDLAFMAFTTILFILFTFKSKTVKRWQGIVFILLYVAYIIYVVLRTVL